MTDRPNIIFLMPDEWRADALGCAGNPVVRTPHLDALAARGTRISGVHCDAPICQPSRASLVTGLSVASHGLRDNELSPRTGGAVFPGPERETFLHRLQRSGYYTSAVGKLNFCFPEWELAKELRAQGLDAALGADEFSALLGSRHLDEFTHRTRAYGLDEVHEEADKQTLLLFDSGYTDSLRARGLLDQWRAKVATDSAAYLHALLRGDDAPMYSSEAALTEPEPVCAGATLDSYIADRAVRVISEHHEHRSTQPLFLWVTFVGPHPPFDAPDEDWLSYDGDAIPVGPPGPPDTPPNRWGDFVRWTQARTGAAKLPASVWTKLAAQYYGGCTLIDSGIGRIIAELEANDMLHNTWIVFGSDHGELLGDHGMVQKRVFYRSSVEVPGIVAPPPGTEPALSGRVANLLAQNIDVTATIVDIATDATEFGEGRSLLPVLRGQSAPRSAVTSEIADFRMIRTATTKAVVDAGTGQEYARFDLEADPDEQVNLCGADAADSLG